jgi:hypothetical protein
MIIFIMSLFPILVEAGLQVGSGFNSATGGRIVPSVNLGVGSDSFRVLFSSTGVATSAYYQSSYTQGAYWTQKAGEIFGGAVVTGFGVGGLYAERGFLSSSSVLEKKGDYVLGPAFFSQWNFLGPVFIGVEGLYGLIGPSNRYYDIVSLNARDHVNFIIGVSL